MKDDDIVYSYCDEVDDDEKTNQRRYNSYININGIDEDTKDLVYNHIFKLVSEGSEFDSLLIKLSFNSDRLLMVIDIKDIEEQMIIISNYLNDIINNPTAQRIAFPREEVVKHGVRILYHRNVAKTLSKYGAWRNEENDTSSV